ncbi:MAG: ABC transporter ATP-binding protein [Alphaproteobacteria bacterium]|nr:ABC transporter ATP-binding protein [Alphaproteobacteria bacterium]
MLKVTDLDVRYGAVTAASGVSLEVRKGEIVALLGPNGAGKTSVLKAIMGLNKQANGVVEYFDGTKTHRIDKMETHEMAKLGIANIPSSEIVLPRMNVEENLEVGGRFLYSDMSFVRKRMDELFMRFPILRERRKQAAATLSGGEQRQLAVARGLMCEPKLMLLDEPSLGLAPILLRDLFATLKRIRDEFGVEMLIVEQNVNKALEIADRAYVMRIGSIDFHGPAKEVAASERLRDAYLGS